MKNINFPVKIIVKTIIEETRQKFDKPVFDQERQEMLALHIEKIQSLETYEQVNDWLLQYRGLSLIEWVESL